MSVTDYIDLTEADLTEAVAEWVNKHKLDKPHIRFDVRFSTQLTQVYWNPEAKPGMEGPHPYGLKAGFSAVATLLPCPHDSVVTDAEGHKRCGECGTQLSVLRSSSTLGQKGCSYCGALE